MNYGRRNRTVDKTKKMYKELIAMRGFRRIMSVVYAACASYLIFIFAVATIYSLSQTTNGAAYLTIGIIGGPDIRPIPTLLQILPFIISLFAFSFTNIIFSFNKKISIKIQWIILLWLFINTIMFKLIPPQSYLVFENIVNRPFNSLSWTSLSLTMLLISHFIIIVLTAVSIMQFHKWRRKEENIKQL